MTRYHYVITGGALHVASLADPVKPRVTAKLDGLGHVRHLVVRKGIAYITAREDGLFQRLANRSR